MFKAGDLVKPIEEEFTTGCCFYKQITKNKSSSVGEFTHFQTYEFIDDIAEISYVSNYPQSNPRVTTWWPRLQVYGLLNQNDFKFANDTTTENS